MLQIKPLAAGPELSASAHLRSLPHVLFVVDGFPKALGGGERIVLRLAGMLPRYGFRASILTFAVHPESAFRPADAPCPVYLLPLTSAFGLQSLQGALALRRFLRAEQIQLVQTFFESSDLWAGLVTRLCSRARLVWSRRDMGILRGRKHQLAYRFLRKLPDAVFAVSARVAEHVTGVDGVPPERVHVVHNGLDLHTAQSPASASSAPVITTIGNIRRVKGHDLLIQAMPTVLARVPQARFTIAGEVLEPEFFAELQRTASALGVADHIEFLGKVTDLPHHLATACVFVLPSRSEGFSNALIEAMAAGLPSIATDVGGNAEAIQTETNGLIIPPEDAASLGNAMLRVLEDPAFAQRLSIAARRSAEENFGADAMLRKITAQYRILIGA